MITEIDFYKIAAEAAKKRFFERKAQTHKLERKKSFEQHSMSPTQTITIMADIGNGPYAWIKDALDETRYLGPNIADAYSGFGGKPLVSEALEMDFRHWIIYFESNYNDSGFDWAEFNRQGEELAWNLYLELSGGYRVFYQKPSEDPGHEVQRKIEFPEAGEPNYFD